MLMNLIHKAALTAIYKTITFRMLCFKGMFFKHLCEFNCVINIWCSCFVLPYVTIFQIVLSLDLSPKKEIQKKEHIGNKWIQRQILRTGNIGKTVYTRQWETHTVK